MVTSSGTEDRFAGSWVDTEETLVVIKDAMLCGHGAPPISFTAKGTSCSFVSGKIMYRGVLSADGENITWDDGEVWTRKIIGIPRTADQKIQATTEEQLKQNILEEVKRRGMPQQKQPQQQLRTGSEKPPVASEVEKAKANFEEQWAQEAVSELPQDNFRVESAKKASAEERGTGGPGPAASAQADEHRGAPAGSGPLPSSGEAAVQRPAVVRPSTWSRNELMQEQSRRAPAVVPEPAVSRHSGRAGAEPPAAVPPAYARVASPEGGAAASPGSSGVEAGLKPRKATTQERTRAKSYAAGESLGAAAQNTGTDGPAGGALAPGKEVVIQGLHTQPHLNGQRAVLKKWLEDSGRWQVRIPGKPVILLKPENVVLVKGRENAGRSPGAAARGPPLDKPADKPVGRLPEKPEPPEGKLDRSPGEEGNLFDVRMVDEIDLSRAVNKITLMLRKRGLCTCEANAPDELIQAAWNEASSLWQEGEFDTPTRYLHGHRSQAQVWQQTLYQDEPKVFWINEESKVAHKMKSLNVLSNNMWDLARELVFDLRMQTSVSYTHFWSAMISCYTGDRTYNIHLDNPNGCGESGLPENGLRLSLCYYINPYWDPQSGHNGGGLDVYLTDPSVTPPSIAAARKARRHRIAPHADTLVLFLSQRMAHRVVATQGKEKWFALWVFCHDREAMDAFTKHVDGLGLRAADTVGGR